MRFDVVVEVRPIEGISNPEGQTIERSLPALGFANAKDVSVGKVVRFTLESRDAVAAHAQVTEMCERLLANPVIERYEVAVHPAGEPSR